MPGTDQHVDRRDGLGTKRHRSDSLHAAEHVDFIGAREMHCGDGGGMRLALVGRRAGDDARHAGNLGGDYAHVRRCDHRVAPARHVAADAADRYVLVPEDYARQRLDFDVAQGGALRLREIADLLLREGDVRYGFLRDPGNDSADRIRAQPEGRRRPFIILLREIAHRHVAAFGDVGEYAFDGLPDLEFGGLGVCGGYSLLDVAGHDYLMACGLIGEPVPWVMLSGGALKKNS